MVRETDADRCDLETLKSVACLPSYGLCRVKSMDQMAGISKNMTLNNTLTTLRNLLAHPECSISEGTLSLLFTSFTTRT